MFMNSEYYKPLQAKVKELTPEQLAAKSYLLAKNKQAAAEQLLKIRLILARTFPVN